MRDAAASLDETEPLRQALLRKHLEGFESRRRVMPWVDLGIVTLGVGVATWTLAEVDWAPDTRMTWEAGSWMILAGGGGAALLVPGAYQQRTLMTGALSASGTRWAVDAYLNDSASSNRFSSRSLAAGYFSGAAFTLLSFALAPPPPLDKLAAHHRRLGASLVSPSERARMESDFAEFGTRCPCWPRPLAVSLGSLVALLPAVSGRLRDGRPIPYQGIALAQLPMSLCLLETFTDPYPSYLDALSRLRLTPGVAGAPGLTLGSSF